MWRIRAGEVFGGDPEFRGIGSELHIGGMFLDDEPQEAERELFLARVVEPPGPVDRPRKRYRRPSKIRAAVA